MSAQKNAPVIIKRKKIVSGGGHHGGAWKVAYADFVTAMMAFFMLLWLLNATTEKQRKGIADYFSPTIPIVRISGGGNGSFAGESVFSQDTLTQTGTGATTNNSETGQGVTSAIAEAAAAEQSSFSEIEDALNASSGESMIGDNSMRHIVTRISDEGLIVEFFDLPGEPLFDEKTNHAMPVLQELVKVVSSVFDLVDNQIAISAYTRSYPLVLSRNPVWDNASARAAQVRELLEKRETKANKVQRVTGFADRIPAIDDPMSVRNNRIELILLRTEISR